MTMTLEAFKAKVESFLKRTGVSASTLGRDAIGDSKFVLTLRGNRSPHLRTIEAVEGYMRDWKPKRRTRKAIAK
jgi:hypothetical protein